VIGLLYRADWTGLSLAADVRSETDQDLLRSRVRAVKPSWVPEGRGRSSRGVYPEGGTPTWADATSEEPGGYHSWHARLLIAPGGRYRQEDLVQLDRILELREVLGMNLEEIKGFLDSETRLEEVREAYRARKGLGTKVARAQQRALLEEALALNEALAEQVGAKLTRMDDFRNRLLASAQRCRELLEEL